MIRASSRTVIRALVTALGMGLAGLLVALYMNDGEALSQGRFYLSTLIGAALEHVHDHPGTGVVLRLPLRQTG